MDVHSSSKMTIAYGQVGTTTPRNPAWIFVLRIPESDALTARVHPRLAMSNLEPAR